MKWPMVLFRAVVTPKSYELEYWKILRIMKNVTVTQIMSDDDKLTLNVTRVPLCLWDILCVPLNSLSSVAKLHV